MSSTIRKALALLAACAGLAGAQPVPAQELTVSVWGGGYGETWKKVAVDPFAAQTGIKVTVDMGPSNQRLSKLLAQRGGIDLLFITDHQMAVAKARGLLEPFDPANVPNAANLIGFARDPLGDKLCPAITVLGIGLAYNKDHFPAPPKAWGDLLRSDLKAPPAFMDIAFSVAPSMLVQLAELNGGSIDNIDPGLKAMSDRKSRARFFKLFEVLDWINRGETSIAPMLNTYVKRDPNVPLRFAFPENDAIGVVNLACIVKGTKNKAEAERFLNHYLSDAIQAQMAATFGEMPVTTTAKIPDGVPYEVLTPDRIARLKFYDPVKLGAERQRWIDKFEEAVVAK
ncbi:MAG: extracellular solute-binding protein [Alphaproteobacteria bacterium]|nr:extracellular solute-binding protein [Alphaproteobacteria bacterium]